MKKRENIDIRNVLILRSFLGFKVFHGRFYCITHPWSNFRYNCFTGYKVKYVEDGIVEVIKKTYVRPLQM